MSDFKIEKILNIYNYFDGIMVTDENGVIKYYTNFRTDVYSLQVEQIVGKTILEIHPDLTEEDSTIMQVLKTGQPIYDRVEHLTTDHGDYVTNICSTLPILQNGKIVGAIDFSRSIDDGRNQNIQRRYINLPKMQNQSDALYHLDDIVSASQKVNEIKKQIPMIANTDSAVMIYGETGTGKEMIAQSIHTSGVRCANRFVSQNCAAIPSNLLESILFGTVKGSFTGAEDKAGLFELADGGTLFLDEVNSMEIAMQAKILNAIEEKKVRRIGGDKTIPFDVKVISAVNKNPLDCIKAGLLRQDLFYRLSTVLIEIPALRNRLADIPIMTNYFINQNNRKMNKDVVGVSDDAMELFCQYPWPGNVRELKNVVEGAFNVLSSREIRMENLPPYLTTHYEEEKSLMMNYECSLSLMEKVEEYEKRLIMRAIDSTKNISLAANKLKISKQTLNYKLLKFGLKEKKK
ncbi:arginine utilization regulatory protein [Clostridiales Family XIII bacterium PM5-7]